MDDPSQVAFNSWLDRQLKGMFQAYEAEPLPSDLRNLLEKVSHKSRKEGA